MRKRYPVVLGVLVLVACVATAACGSSGSGSGGGGSATQYTLDVQADMTITPAGAAQTVSKIQQQQVMIGTAIIEVSTDSAQELGVEFLSFDLEPQTQGTVDVQFQLNPDYSATGIIFKACELGNPFGISYLDFALAATSQSDIAFEETETNVLIDDGQALALGGLLRAEAESGDRTRIPVLTDIPVLGFLFEGERHQAQLENLIIILTPQIISDTEG